jgi:hypothetical protein
MKETGCVLGCNGGIAARRQGQKDAITGAKFDTTRSMRQAFQSEHLLIKAGDHVQITHDKMGAPDMDGAA